MSRLPLIPVLLLSICLAAAAAADGTGESSDSVTGRPRAVSRTVGEGARPTVLDPIQGLYAAAFPLANVGVWAQSFGYALTRRQALYDVEGGASWRLDDHVHLTASYRMLGFDLGYDSDFEGADFEPGVAAPFVGMAFDF